jgi:hypothetical protein
MKFEFYEVRPCIQFKGRGDDDHVDSYLSEEDYAKALADVDASGNIYETFWSIYGRYNDGDGAFLAMAIGDFTSKKDAFDVMNAILAPMAAARDMINEHGAAMVPSANTVSREYPNGGTPVPAYQKAANALDDVINQSSNGERI